MYVLRNSFLLLHEVIVLHTTEVQFSFQIPSQIKYFVGERRTASSKCFERWLSRQHQEFLAGINDACAFSRVYGCREGRRRQRKDNNFDSLINIIIFLPFPYPYNIRQLNIDRQMKNCKQDTATGGCRRRDCPCCSDEGDSLRRRRRRRIWRHTGRRLIHSGETIKMMKIAQVSKLSNLDKFLSMLGNCCCCCCVSSPVETLFLEHRWRCNFCCGIIPRIK